jgi:hypothetical protein
VVVLVRDRRKLLDVWIFYGETGGVPVEGLVCFDSIYIYIYYMCVKLFLYI